MTVPRFHVDRPLTVGTSFALPRAQTRHALRALRLREGDMLVLFNGSGGEYVARLVAAREPEAEVHVLGFDPREAELPWAVTIAQGLSSGDRMDWTVEKTVELGAAAIAPLGMARSVVRLSGDRAVNRQAHWQALAVAASGQCGRNRIATVAAVRPLQDALSAWSDASLRLLLAPDGEPSKNIAAPAAGSSVVVLIGPEGGITAEESHAARAAGFRAVSLGPRVLRTETAAPVALAMFTALWSGGASV